MADGKQQQSQVPSEALRGGAAKPDAKRAELMKRAEERLAKIDVASDNRHDAGEIEAKKKALEFISTECLGLPEDRFLKLLDAVELRMKQREAYKRNMLEEFRKARAEIMEEISTNPDPSASTTKAKAENVPAPKPNPNEPDGVLVTNGVKGDPKKLSSYDYEMIGDHFNPHLSDVSRSIGMMIGLNRQPVLSGQFLIAVDANPKTVAGMMLYWNKNHPVRREMERLWLREALRIVDDAAQKYRETYSFEDFSRYSGTKAEKFIAERVKAWKNKDSYAKTGNRVMDGLNLDRNLFKKGFSPNSSELGIGGYTQYVERAANYLEYAADKNGKAEFIRQATEHPDSTASFLLDWNHNNRIYQVLQLRGEGKTINWVDSMKVEIMRHYGLKNEDLKKEKGQLEELLKRDVAKDQKYLAKSREAVVKLAFEPSAKEYDDETPARYLSLITLDTQSPEWERFVDELNANKDALSKFLAHWPNLPLRNALAKTPGGADSIRKLGELHEKLRVQYGIPRGTKHVPTVAKLLEKNAGLAKERRELSLEIDKKYPNFRKEIERGFEKIKKAMAENQLGNLRKAQAELSELSGKDLLPLQTRASELFKDSPNHPEWKKVTSLRVAIEALCSINITDHDNEFLNWAKSNVKWGAIAAEISAKEWQLEKILNGNDFGAVVGFENQSLVGNFAAEVGFGEKPEDSSPHKKLASGDLDAAVRERRIEEINSEAFAQSLCLAFVSGNLGPEKLVARWGEYRVMQIALYWGIDDQGNDAGFTKSRAYAKLKATNRTIVAEEFRQSLQTFMKGKAGQMEKLEAETVDRKALVEYVRKLKPAASQKEAEGFIEKMKVEQSSSKRWDMLKGLKGSELTVEDLREFYEALEKVQTREAKTAREEVKALPSHEKDLPTHPDYVRLLEATAKHAGSKNSEEKADFDFLRNPKVLAVPREEDHENGGRGRKLKELGAENAKKLLKIARKHLDANSELRKYLESYVRANEKEVLAAHSRMGRDNASAEHSVHSKADKEADPKKREAIRRKVDALVAWAAAVAADVKERKEYGVPWPLVSEEQEKNLRDAVEAAQDLRKLTGESFTFGRDSELAKAFGKKPGDSLETGLEEIADKLRAERIAMEKSAAERREAEKREAAISSHSTATRFLRDAEAGDSVRVTDSVTATKTDAGWLEIRTPAGKIRFSAHEAQGAAETMEMLKSAEAAFLIPAMKEIAAVSGISFKSGIGREEARKMLSSLALALGYDSISDEVDPRVLLGKFRAASEWAFWGPSLSERMRKYGIVDDLGSLSREGLRKRMLAVSGTSAKEAVGT